MKTIVILCNRHAGTTQATAEGMFFQIKTVLYSKMIAMMKSVANICEEPEIPEPSGTHYSSEFMSLFETDWGGHPPSSPNASTPTSQLNDTRIQEEFDRWMSDPISRTGDGGKESVLLFWKRQLENSKYLYLPKVARILFAIPTSSGQIERDFGSAGRLVTPQRASLGPEHIDMSSFLRLNHKFVDLTQVEPITTTNVNEVLPRSIWVEYDNLLLSGDDVNDAVVTAMEGISNTSLYEI